MQHVGRALLDWRPSSPRLHVVKKAPRRRDEHVHPLLELLRLHPAVRPAHDEAVRLRVLLEQLPGDAVRLHRELARGREDEGAGAVAGHPPRGVEELDAAGGVERGTRERGGGGGGVGCLVGRRRRRRLVAAAQGKSGLQREKQGTEAHQGMRNARVLPEPVRAAPSRSRPVRSGGMVRA